MGMNMTWGCGRGLRERSLSRSPTPSLLSTAASANLTTITGWLFRTLSPVLHSIIPSAALDIVHSTTTEGHIAFCNAAPSFVAKASRPYPLDSIILYHGGFGVPHHECLGYGCMWWSRGVCISGGVSLARRRVRFVGAPKPWCTNSRGVVVFVCSGGYTPWKLFPICSPVYFSARVCLPSVSS